MAYCTSIDIFGGLVNEFIGHYEKLLKTDNLPASEVSAAKDALEQLHAFRKASDANDKDYVQSQGFVYQQNAIKQEIMENAFKEAFGTDFEFSEGTSKKVKAGSMLSVKPTTNNNILVEFLVDGLPKSYTFSILSDGKSVAESDGKHITIKDFDKFLASYTEDLAKFEELEIAFGSKDTKLKLGERYKDKDYVHGSQEAMKDTLLRLHVLGGEKATQEELDSYLDLIDSLKPAFFNALNLYVQENADNSEGVARATRIDIAVNSAPRTSGNQQSEASIYLEEVVHSMVTSAMHSNTIKARRLKRQLTSMIEAARDQIKWQDFLPKESINAAEEEAYAKWLHRYIFTGKNADYEFIAKALAVPEVTAKLKHLKVKEGADNRRILERVNDFFAAILDILQGTITLKQKNQNMHEALVNLAFSFGEINTRAQRTLADKGGYTSALFDIAYNIDATAARALNKIKDKIIGDSGTKPFEDMPKDLYNRVKWLGRFFTLVLVNPSYTKAMGAIATAWGLKPEGTVREIIGGLFATDSAQKVAEFLVMQSGAVDKYRNNQIDIVRKNALSEFQDPKEVTKDMEEALTAVIADTDLSGLFGKNSVAKDANLRKTVYDNKTLRELLTDEVKLDRLIKDAKRALKEADNTHYYWHSNQAVGLGIYMATHKGTPEQNFNAENIVRGIHSSHRKGKNPAALKAINELATLVAIKNTDRAQRETVAKLMETEWKGVQHIADLVEGFKKNSDETVFKKFKTNKIKGYTREVFDDTIVMEIAPLTDKDKMEKQGFTFRSTLAPRAGDIRNETMALYITDSAGRPDRLRGGVRLNQIRSKGTSITDISYKDGEGLTTSVIRTRAQRDINNIQRAALERAKKMELGDYDFTDTIFGVAAVINDAGKVTDYRYMMDKATKKELLKQDTRISEVLARSYGNILDKDMSATHNERALEILRQDMASNWTAGDKGNDGLTDYIRIGPKVSDPEMRKLYAMLPREFQEFIQNREDKTLAVRADLHYIFFGYSHMSIANFPGLAKITPPVLLKVIKFAEMIWMEMIKIVKTNILMKMPTILMSNIFSNFVYGVMRGYNPIELTSLYVESYRDISEYNKQLKEIQNIKNNIKELVAAKNRDVLSKQRLDSINSSLSKADAKLKAYERRLKESPIHELVALGLDQNVEDITNDVEHDSNRITNFFDTQLDKLPQLIRTGTDILFITKRTKFYKIANEFLETSDLVARDIQNRMEIKIEHKQADGKLALPNWWLENQDKGYPAKQRLTGKEREVFLAEAKNKRHYDLIEDFINYAKPSGRLEEYLNKVGILMFTKYVKRIQRIILKTGSNAPIKSSLALLGISFIGGLPSIHEQSFLVKDWYGDSIGPGNVFPVYSPIENFMTFITPSLLKSSTYDFSL